MLLVGGNIGMEAPGDPFYALEGINSTSSTPVLMGTTATTSGTTTTSGTSSIGTSSSGTSQPIYIEPYNESMDVIVTSNTVTTPTSSSSSTPTATIPSFIGNLAGNFGMGSGTASSGASVSKKESLLDKWKKLSDLKKGLIILAIAAGSYYGYKQLKK